jgi:hypothetical protein
MSARIEAFAGIGERILAMTAGRHRQQIPGAASVISLDRSATVEPVLLISVNET